MKYHWILFDADDTLFDFKRSARHAFEQTMADFAITLQNGHFDLYKGINDEVWRAFENREITAEQLRFLRFERFFEAIGEWRDPAEISPHYLCALSQTGFLIDGAVELVEHLLEENFRLGLITNGLREVQRPRLQRADMERHFDLVVVSDEIGVSKPHEGFFQHAFEQMKSPPKEKVLVVGDSLHSDIAGGNGFGLHTCWYNPKQTANLTEHLPTYEIHDLQALKDILKTEQV